jgi:hypothetical protein
VPIDVHLADVMVTGAASGQAAADPAITLMNSRRCITVPMTQEHADNWLITIGARSTCVQ